MPAARPADLYTAAVLLSDILILLATGLAAGALGGMLGIGGSIVMIPVLTLVLRYNHHLSQAAAMIVNVFVAAPAAVQHHRAKAIRWDVMGRMLLPGLAMIIVGVEASNAVDAERLKQMFGLFLLYVVLTNVFHLMARRPEPQPHQQRSGWIECIIIGGATGFIAGLLGVGGGIIAVPLLQRVARLPLRQCIGTTATFMCVTATFGSLHKNLALAHLVDEAGASLGLSAADSVTVAAVLAPTAVIGGLIGGRLTRVLPLGAVRIVFIALMLWAAGGMLGVI